MNKIILTVAGLFWLIACPVSASSSENHQSVSSSKHLPSSAFATKHGDTLFVGNGQITRSILITSNSIRTLSLREARSGTEYKNNTSANDLVLVKGPITDIQLSCNRLSDNNIHASGAIATLSYQVGNLQIKREYVVYDDAPAIACNTYLRGNLKLTQHNSKETSIENNADRKNIESTADMKWDERTPVLDRLFPGGNHWHCRAVEFFDCTDWNNNLVNATSFIPYRRTGVRGNLLIAEDGTLSGGFFFLKEAPCSSTQLHYDGKDFITEFGNFSVTGFGLAPDDISPDHWTRAYSVVLGVFAGGETEALSALRRYQKQIRAQAEAEDDMVMMNTWGDRSQDSRINEAFCLNELERAHQLGINVFQLDDGWQKGKSPNSKSGKGSFKDIWKDSLYWTPDPVKFPNGLTRVVEKARKLNMRLGLWFNPSIQNDFADWKKDAYAVLALWQRYGITIFKIDGVQINTKNAEEHLRCFFDSVAEQSKGKIIFNLDVTAGRRGGYNMFNEYGNIFLENRYTDWGNYYPYQTLRNLWQLSAYVPAERLQIEFLNKWRNTSKYQSDDPFAPSRYSFDYLFAITMVAQPLAWMEASNLPSEAFSLGDIVKRYTRLQRQIHKGVILPIGEEPSGRSWTGFQSIVNEHTGFLLVFREDTDRATARLQLRLPKNSRVQLKTIIGDGANSEVNVDEDGKAELSLPRPNTYCLYSYKIL
jgi:alpha-galactosidase